ncbi:hypothetical protein ACFQJ8_12885 [Halocatena marina]
MPDTPDRPVAYRAYEKLALDTIAKARRSLRTHISNGLQRFRCFQTSKEIGSSMPVVAQVISQQN